MIGEQLRERICLIARTSPSDWGITGFSTWSLSKLREHLIQRCSVVAISTETLRDPAGRWCVLAGHDHMQDLH